MQNNRLLKRHNIGRNLHRRRNARSRRARNGVNIKSISRRDPSFPPENKTRPKNTRTLRFVGAGTAGVDYPVTRRCLLNLVLCGVSGSTAATVLYESVKLNRVSMYMVPDPTAGFGDTTSELVLTWTGDRAPDVRLSDRGTLSHPACIKSRPPQDSLAGFWSTISADLDETLFTFRASSEVVIIDLDLIMTLGDGATRTVTIVNPALTGILYSALDNAVPAGTVGTELFVPDALTAANMTTP